MPTIQNYRGIIPAIACPFTADHRIDEPALAAFLLSPAADAITGQEIQICGGASLDR